MKHNLDIMALAVPLVRELGEDAVIHCRTRLVELIAANHRRGANFWRQVMEACESELASSRSVLPGASTLSPDPGGMTLPPAPN